MLYSYDDPIFSCLKIFWKWLDLLNMAVPTIIDNLSQVMIIKVLLQLLKFRHKIQVLLGSEKLNAGNDERQRHYSSLLSRNKIQPEISVPNETHEQMVKMIEMTSSVLPKHTLWYQKATYTC